MTRRPCRTCPWRRSTPVGGFPGGRVDVPGLLRGVRGSVGAPAMQCHATPSGPDAQVCVGFALVVGFDSVPLRLAAILGRYDPDQVAPDPDDPLHTLDSLVAMHGTMAPTGCRATCRGCTPDCPNRRRPGGGRR